MAGRPTKLTPETIEKYLEGIRKGLTKKAACGYAHIAYNTLMSWQAKAEKAKEEERRDKYVKFMESVTDAENEAYADIEEKWIKSIPYDWRAAKEFLARRNREDWGDKIEIDGKIDGLNIILPEGITPNDI